MKTKTLAYSGTLMMGIVFFIVGLSQGNETFQIIGGVFAASGSVAALTAQRPGGHQESSS